jgi:L-alanine-DL-glutamate epimerase-like enolase superfamily enzyme
MKNTIYIEVMGKEENRGFGVKNNPRIDREGYIRPPSGPGLGLEIAWESLGKPVETL